MHPRQPVSARAGRLTRWLGGWVLAVLALAAAGCANTYSFKVDAMRNPELPAAGQSYRLVSGDPAVKESDLQFKETATYVKAALSGQGLYEAPDPAEADLIVEVAFGMGPPTTEFRTVTEPIMADVGGGVRYVTQVVRNPDGSTSVIRVPVVEPSRRQVVGYSDRTLAETTYEKYLRVTASDARERNTDETPVQVWSVAVRNQDTSDDLRKYLPLMTAAALPVLGQQTEGQQEVTLKEEDAAVAFVRTKP